MWELEHFNFTLKQWAIDRSPETMLSRRGLSNRQRTDKDAAFKMLDTGNEGVNRRRNFGEKS
jgi:hypothetical protein